MPETLEEHYPDMIKNLNAYFDRRAEELTKEERTKIESELEEVEGFIEVEKKREEIDKRHSEIIEADSTLNKIAAKIEELDRTEGLGIKE